MTIVYKNAAGKPPRINTPLEIGPYTFTDENLAIIDLTATFIAVSISCELKLQRAPYATVAGTIVNGPGGIVNVPSYTFTTAGTWTYQFFAYNAAGQRLPGEPVQFLMAGNVEDAGLNDLVQP